MNTQENPSSYIKIMTHASEVVQHAHDSLLTYLLESTYQEGVGGIVFRFGLLVSAGCGLQVLLRPCTFLCGGNESCSPCVMTNLPVGPGKLLHAVVMCQTYLPVES